MRTGIVVWCLFLCTAAFSQQDSTLLDSVTIYGLPIERYLVGSTIQSIDSSLLARQTSSHLGDVIALQHPIYFRNYGSGMISTISMRGTSPQHTAVLWNNININSFSLGQADFSILPATAFEEVKIHEGGGSALFGSGAFGGTVLLNSIIKEENSIALTQEVGSFGKLFSSLRGAVSLKRWNFTTKLYNHQAENDFLILSTGDKQQHASYIQLGLLQDVQYQLASNKTISLHYWYHHADRDIPPIIGGFNSTDEQEDVNHRISIQYKGNYRRGSLVVYSGFVDDAINWNRKPGHIQRWIGGSTFEYNLRHTTMKVGGEWNNITGRIPEYNGSPTENRYDLTTSIHNYLGDRAEIVINLRQPFVTGFNTPFLPYLGVSYFAIKKHEALLKINGNVSRNYRIPTFNDRYWPEAGNINLLPELSYAAEVGWQGEFKKLKIENTWFVQHVDDWIQWTPEGVNSQKFIPKNLKKVEAKGASIQLSYNYDANKFKVFPKITYQYTKSVNVKAYETNIIPLNKQLILTPLHTATGSISMHYKRYSMDLFMQYYSKRYLYELNDEDNILPFFNLINISLGRHWVSHHHKFHIVASVKNVLNKEYQTYPSQAMPGRNYNIQLSYLLNSKIK